MFAPERIRLEPALFSVMPVTFAPIVPLMVVAPLLLPELRMVPALLTELSPIVPLPFALRVRLPVLVKLPVNEELVPPWFHTTFILPV